MHRLFFLPQLRGVPLPSRILCGRSPPGSWKGRRPDQDAVEDPAPESWPTAAGADQAAQAAAGRLRAPGESLCHYGHSQEDESGRGRLRPSRIPPGSWKASGRIGKTREIQRGKAGQRQRAQIRPRRPSIIHFDNISIASFFPSGLSCINRETISRILDE